MSSSQENGGLRKYLGENFSHFIGGMVHRAAGRPVSGDEVVAALCAGFSAALNITLQESAFTPDEEAPGNYCRSMRY